MAMPRCPLAVFSSLAMAASCRHVEVWASVLCPCGEEAWKRERLPLAFAPATRTSKRHKKMGVLSGTALSLGMWEAPSFLVLGGWGKTRHRAVFFSSGFPFGIGCGGEPVQSQHRDHRMGTKGTGPEHCGSQWCLLQGHSQEALGAHTVPGTHRCLAHHRSCVCIPAVCSSTFDPHLCLFGQRFTVKCYLKRLMLLPRETPCSEQWRPERSKCYGRILPSLIVWALSSCSGVPREPITFWVSFPIS